MVCALNETIIKRIEQDLSSEIGFVSLTSVSQRLVNDCMFLQGFSNASTDDSK